MSICWDEPYFNQGMERRIGRGTCRQCKQVITVSLAGVWIKHWKDAFGFDLEDPPLW